MPALDPRLSHFALILPLCTSSITLGLSLWQYPMFNAFLTPPQQKHHASIAGRPVSAYWAALVPQGIPVIVAFPVISTIAGLLSARWLFGHATLETTTVGKWYTAGAALAAGHFLFVPVVAPLIQKIADAGKEEGLEEREVEERNRRFTREWFGWHTVRIVVADLPALFCFAEGVALSLWVI